MNKTMLKRALICLSALVLIALPCIVFAGDAKETDIISLQNERGGGGNECYQYVKNIRQTKTYNCGMTNVLQALYGIGYEDQVPGSTDAEKINNMDARYNVDSQGQTIVYQVRDALNYYIPSSITYQYTLMTNVTIYDFEEMIADSLMHNKPVILHAKTTPLSYYNGHTNYHYLCIDYINRTMDMVRIVDTHPSSSYYGIHYVTLQEAYQTVSCESGRYIIH